jgi:hypothetical protein
MYNLNNFISDIKLELSSYDTNFGGHGIDGKYVIFESDDWGSIRMPNRNVFESLLKAGIPVNKSVYCRFDSLESNDDLEFLLEVFTKHRNVAGVVPCLTMNFVTANPDFEKIRENEFQSYFYEPISRTYENSVKSSAILKILQQGIDTKACIPQFHGRDHVNVPFWLKLLKTDKFFRIAFDHGVWGLSRDIYNNHKCSVQATYDSIDEAYTKGSIREGLQLFEDQFGFKSKSFIANNFIWSNNLEGVLFEGGVIHYQTAKFQLIPFGNSAKRSKVRRPFGSINRFGQTYAPRNCFYEPTEFSHSYTDTLKQISRAFMYKKPAIVSMHRINFSGSMDLKKRDRNLENLDNLLSAIIKMWPDVQFISSHDIYGLIKNS